jgi:hypothetical protein
MTTKDPKSESLDQSAVIAELMAELRAERESRKQLEARLAKVEVTAEQPKVLDISLERAKRTKEIRDEAERRLNRLHETNNQGDYVYFVHVKGFKRPIMMRCDTDRIDLVPAIFTSRYGAHLDGRKMSITRDQKQSQKTAV